MDYMINKIEEFPDFLKLGEQVYVVYGPGKIKRARIDCYNAKVFEDPELGNVSCCPFAAVFSTYFTNDYFGNINWNIVPFDFIAKDENQAKEWAKFYPVKCSDEDWYKAIGSRPGSLEISDENDEKLESLDDCELGTCCSTISDIRSMLIKCRDHKGLIGMEIIHLRSIINNGSHDMPEDAFILEKILKQLKIKWE